MSKPIDPGTPEARRAWLDSLPVGSRLRCPDGEFVKHPFGWLPAPTPDGYDPADVEWWCAEPDFWPAEVLDAPAAASSFACPADWTPPQPAEVRAMLAKAGLSQVEAARSLGMSRSAVAKWLSGESRCSWPAWRVLVALAGERD